MEGEESYFDPLFDAYSLRVIDLREILNQYQIYFPSTAKKVHLVELFDKLRKAKQGSLSIHELQKENAPPNRSPRRKFLEMTAIDSGFGTPSTANTPMRITRSSARGIDNSARKFLPFNQRSESLDEEEEVEILKQEQTHQGSPVSILHTDTHQTSPKHYNWEELMDTPAVTHFPEAPKVHPVHPVHNLHFENLQNRKDNITKENKVLGRSSIPTVEIPVHSRSPSSSQTPSANVGLEQNSSPKLPDSTFLASPTLAVRPARRHGAETQTSPMFLSKHQKSSPDIQSSSNTSIYASPLKSPSKFQNFVNLFPSRRTPLGETNSQSVTQTPPREYLQFQSDSEPEFSPKSVKTVVNKGNDKSSPSPVSNSSSLFASHLENYYAKDQSLPGKSAANTPLSFFTVRNRSEETYSPNEEFAESLFAQKGVRSDTTNRVLNNVSLSSTENSLFGEEEPLQKDSQKYSNKMGNFRIYGLFLSVLFVALSLAFWQQEVRRVGFCETPEEPYPSYISSIKPEPVRSTLQSVYTYLNVRGLKAKCMPCPSSAKCGSNRDFACSGETKPHIPFLSRFGFKPFPSCTILGSVTDRIENMVKGCVDMVEDWYTQNESKPQFPSRQELSHSHFHSSVIDKFYEKFKDKMDSEVTMDEFKVYFRQALERLHILKRKNNRIPDSILTMCSRFKGLTSYFRDIINTNVVTTLNSKSSSISHSMISFVSSVHQKFSIFDLRATLQLTYDNIRSMFNQLITSLSGMGFELLAKITHLTTNLIGMGIKILAKITHLTTNLSGIGIELFAKITHLTASLSGMGFDLLATITEKLVKSWKKYSMTVLYVSLTCVAIPYIWSLFVSFYSTEKLVKVCVKHCVSRLQSAKKKSLKDVSKSPRLQLDDLRAECFVSHPEKSKDFECLRETSNIIQKRVWRRSTKAIDQMVSVRVFDEKSTNKRAWEWIGVLPDNSF
ncbi:LEM domain nuclear inner membrane protein Man1, Sad1 interacting factor [Schizosaccharomyces osmophilus]|uniref:LEM domain nuclear inner membrane protein Man1, Sad1 interacting factor n=1 Tax=Schizosaccharomyces osmophilus TaxID=2545709 RepID=A0AAE9WD62_9SCHI|nr:LEM domain nuclear inner membrane protein Man1, Sad1 interacting factor [Schizosaccharomyces osmophilus]WBW73693.1 LEM domain nuclear inner membrane protein Man1, Sad1 interacting factor [Schizosaccharomyces osmophilus]